MLCAVGSNAGGDSAFTFVRVPEWMTRWQGGPPVLAEKAWRLLDDTLKQQISNPGSTYVSPRYLRLAMGGSHSVYILMRINLHHIGKGLYNYVNEKRSELANEPTDATPPFETMSLHEPSVPDQQWKLRQEQRRCADSAGSSGYTVDQWCQRVRLVKQQTARTFVVTHFFAGERRYGDIEEQVENMCEQQGLTVLMISVDLATDANWDYTNAETFHKIMQLIEEGLIDVVLGGPRCSTVSRSRHVKIPGGPRPLRFRNCT